jgi:hypothetical protein
VEHGPFRLGDHTKYILLLVADPCNVIHSARDIDLLGNYGKLIAVPEQDLFMQPHPHERIFLGGVTAISGGDGDPVCLAVGKLPGHGRLVVIRLDIGVRADKALVPVHPQRARDQSRFAQDPETVADADQYPAPVGKLQHRPDDRRVFDAPGRTG